MKGKIYLIGGGEINKGETKEIDYEIIKNSKKGSTFVFFGTAANDAVGYSVSIHDVFDKHFDVIVANIVSGEGIESTRQILKIADVIYLGGGNTQLLMDMFEKYELVNLLVEANERGAAIAGMSAGALALSRHYIHEDENGEMTFKEGWDIADVCSFVHATNKNIEKARKIYREETASRSMFVGIAEKSALVIDGRRQNNIGRVWEHS